MNDPKPGKLLPFTLKKDTARRPRPEVRVPIGLRIDVTVTPETPPKKNE